MRTTRTRPLQTLYLEIVITCIAITQGFQFTLKVGSTKSFKQTRRTIQKKDLNDPDNHDGVITHLHPDILECKLKWALGSVTRNKASGGDRIPADLFQILKDDAVKMLHSICQQIWKTQQWPQDQKSSLHSNPKERQCQRMFKLLYNFTHLTCQIVMLKILQVRLQQFVN